MDRKWWNEYGWKVRCSIYSILIFPTEAIRFMASLLGLILDLYDKFVAWFLWDVMNFLFKYRGEK